MSVGVSGRRHVFIGTVGEQCENEASECGLNYSASLHYNDDDHPYDPPSEAEGWAACQWRMQNVPAGLTELYCLREEADAVHHHDDEPVTERIEMPSAGRPVMDVPYEDGAMGDAGSWAARMAERVEGIVSGLRVSPGEIGIPVGKEGSAARARWNLENAEPVKSGPWSVRQWYAPDGGLPEDWEEPGELICALNVLGEPFTVETWWADSSTRMVRVVWGALYGVGDKIFPMVESWPEG